MRFTRVEETELELLITREKASTNQAWSHAMLLGSLSSGADCQRISIGQELIGYWLVQRVLDEATLLNFVIFSPHQSQGLGARAIRKMQAGLADEGVNTIFLEVRASNAAAIQLYKHSGFTQIDRRKNYYRARDAAEGRYPQAVEDALVLRWDL